MELTFTNFVFLPIVFVLFSYTIGFIVLSLFAWFNKLPK